MIAHVWRDGRCEGCDRPYAYPTPGPCPGRPVLSVGGLSAPRGLPPCPLCGAVLELVLDGEVAKAYAPAFHVIGQPVPYRLEPRPFLACSGCEYCEEVR